MEAITRILEQTDNVMYYPILIIVMSLAGFYFTVLTRGVQIRLFPEAVRLLLDVADVHHRRRFGVYRKHPGSDL